MITSLHIQNFKCWQDTGEFRLAPITGFFGANSSGKTSILQFLLMLKQTVESSDPGQILNLGDQEKDYVRLGALRDVFYQDQYQASAGLFWSIAWSEKSAASFRHARLLTAEIDVIERNDLPELVVKEFSYGRLDPSLMVGLRLVDYDNYVLTGTGFEYQNNILINRPPVAPNKFYGFGHNFITSVLPPNIQRLAEELPNEFRHVFEDMYYLGPLREYPKREYIWGGGKPSGVGRRGENAVSALLASRLRKPENGATVEQKVAEWLKKLELIYEFKIEEIAKDSSLYIVRVQQTPDSAFVPITDVGFGVSQVLPVLTLCYYVPQGSIIIFEQPEIHLHPAVQTRLADVFIEAAQERNLQIILESHSEHLLSRLQRRIADETVKRDDVQLYFCKRESAAARLEPLQINNFGFITNWPPNFFGDDMEERSAMMLAAIARQEKGETE